MLSPASEPVISHCVLSGVMSSLDALIVLPRKLQNIVLDSCPANNEAVGEHYHQYRF